MVDWINSGERSKLAMAWLINSRICGIRAAALMTGSARSVSARRKAAAANNKPLGVVEQVVKRFGADTALISNLCHADIGQTPVFKQL